MKLASYRTNQSSQMGQTLSTIFKAKNTLKSVFLKSNTKVRVSGRHTVKSHHLNPLVAGIE